MADQHHGQTGSNSLQVELLYVVGHVCLDRGRDGISVQYLRRCRGCHGRTTIVTDAGQGDELHDGAL